MIIWRACLKNTERGCVPPAGRDQPLRQEKPSHFSESGSPGRTRPTFFKQAVGKFPFLAVALSSLFAVSGFGAAHDPADELAAFQLADGFEANLFASEADGIVNPIQCRFDPQGRLYVACSWIYPQLVPGEKADDKIIVLEDTDRDGKADRSTVFADGLFIPTGLEWGDGGIYVGNGTELIHLKDADGDGRAEERRVVLRGFGTGDSHQNINSFHWSPGGELWFSQGLHAFARVETPWGISKLDHAGIWRWRPRRLRLDGFFGGGMAPHNPWGFVHDEWGRLIVVAGNGHGIHDPLPVLIRGHRHRELRQIWEDYRGRKLCGVDLIQNDHFPESWQGLLVAGGFINNAVYTLRVDEDGSGLKVRDEPPLLQSSSTSFRPVDVKAGPDGAIYIADWSNPIIGHYQASFRHPDRDKTHGRIWRITAKGRPLMTPPDFSRMNVSEILDQLKAEDHWTRYQARRLLADAETGAVTKALASWIQNLSEEDPRLEHHLFEALAVYESHEVVNGNLLQCLLGAKDHRARAYATGVAGRWHDRLENPLTLLEQQVRDPHPRVRLAAVVAASYVPAPRAVEVAAMAVDQPMDDFLNYALEQAVYVLKPHWLAAFQAGRLVFENDQNRLEFVLQADGTRDTFQSLLRLLEDPSLSRDTRASFLNILIEVGNADDLRRVFEKQYFTVAGDYDAALQAGILSNLVRVARLRQVRPSGDLAGDVAALLQGGSAPLRVAAYRLAGAWELASLEPRLIESAATPAEDSVLRAAAIEGLAGLSTAGSGQLLETLATSGQPSAVRAAAIGALVRRDLQRAAALAALVWAEESGEEFVTELLPVFLQRTEGGSMLAAALRKRKPRTDAANRGLQWMSETGRSDEALLQVLTEAAGLGGKRWRLSDVDVEQLVEEVRAQGDRKRGAEIFRRPELGCLACHVVGEEGGRVGPDLNSIGAGQPIDFIIGAILEPNREVKESFEATEITTKDGDVYEGFLARSDAREVVIKDVAWQEEIRLRRDNIESLRDRGSLMPAGLVDSLDRAELRDLVRYLSELGKPVP